MHYEWLLFDADGTLFDYEAAEEAALTWTFDGAGLAFDADLLAAYQRINGQLWQDFEAGKTTPDRIKVDRFADLLSYLAEARGIEPPISAVEFSQVYLTNLGNCTHLIADAQDVLDAARTSARLALITNGLSAVQRSRLAKSGLDAVFEAVTISEEEGVAKPDPRLFDIAFRRMGEPAKEAVLMIGDSLTSDMRGAARYGIDACWFNPEGAPHDPQVPVRYEIRALRELLQFLPGT